MRIVGHRHAVGSKNIPPEPESSFASVTKRFVSSRNRTLIKCPSCGCVIDFKMGVEWQGPDTFTCGVCERHLSMNLVYRALRDLGVE